MNPPIDLAGQLSDYQNAARQRADPARIALIDGATHDLRATGIESSALGVGDRAPEATLPDAGGSAVGLSTLWSQGPLVVVFYRGGWCPYCNLTLRAWQAYLPGLAACGASLVAISPQPPDRSLDTAQKNALAYPVLSDQALRAADAFGITFTMSPALQALYTASGNDLPVVNGNGEWKLPIPATFVVDRHGIVRYADVDADYTARAEPSVVLAAIAAMNRFSDAGPASA